MYIAEFAEVFKHRKKEVVLCV